MKKIILAISAITIFAISAYAVGFLESEEVRGMNKICFYSDGSALTVSSMGFCPAVNK